MGYSKISSIVGLSFDLNFKIDFNNSLISLESDFLSLMDFYENSSLISFIVFA